MYQYPDIVTEQKLWNIWASGIKMHRWAKNLWIWKAFGMPVVKNIRKHKQQYADVTEKLAAVCSCIINNNSQSETELNV